MRRCTPSELRLGGALLVAGVCLAQPARADVPTCSSVAGTTLPLYVVGSSAAQPVVAQLAYEFLLESMAMSPAVQPTTLFYQPSGSCVGVTDLLTDTGPMMSCAGAPCVTGLAYYFPTPSPALGTPPVPQLCSLDPEGDHIDIAISDVDVATCGPHLALGTTYLDTKSAAVAMTFAVPGAMPVNDSITPAQAYFVFGFTCGGGVLPWVNPQTQFAQGPESGVALILDQAIGLPPGNIQGVLPPDFSQQQGSPSEFVLNQLVANAASSYSETQTIGMLPSSFLDPARKSQTLSALAFQPAGASYAYYPDSTATAFDKQNVRDGHYPTFGYLHAITRVANDGQMTPPNAKFMVNVLSETRLFSDPGFSMFDTLAESSYVPLCAMTVQRTTDALGTNGYPQVSTYADPEPCECAFEYAADPNNQVPAGCKQCTDDADCQTGSNNFCNRGFCEAR